MYDDLNLDAGLVKKPPEASSDDLNLDAGLVGKAPRQLSAIEQQVASGKPLLTPEQTKSNTAALHSNMDSKLDIALRGIPQMPGAVLSSALGTLGVSETENPVSDTANNLVEGAKQIVAHPGNSADLILDPNRELINEGATERKEGEASGGSLAARASGGLKQFFGQVPVFGPGLYSAAKEAAHGYETGDPYELAHGAGSGATQLAMLGSGDERVQKATGDLTAAAKSGGAEVLNQAAKIPDVTAGAKDVVANWAKNSAKQNINGLLNATTKPMKAKSANVAENLTPERIAKINAPTVDSMQEKVQAQRDAAGEKIDEIYAANPKPIPVADVIEQLERYKNQFTIEKKMPDGSTRSVPYDAEGQKAIDRLSQIQESIQNVADPDGNLDPIQMRKLRKLYDATTYATGKLTAFTGAETQDINLRAQAADALRGAIARNIPGVSEANADFKFYNDLDDVITATKERRVGQGQMGSLGQIIMTGTGAVVGSVLGSAFGPGGTLGGITGGAAVGKYLTKLVRSTAWETTSARAKLALAQALESRDPQAINAAIQQIIPPERRLPAAHTVFAPSSTLDAEVPKLGPPIEPTTRAQRKGLLLTEGAPPATPAPASTVMTGSAENPVPIDTPLQSLYARSNLVRDPATGRMKRMYVTEGAPEPTPARPQIAQNRPESTKQVESPAPEASTASQPKPASQPMAVEAKPNLDERIPPAGKPLNLNSPDDVIQRLKESRNDPTGKSLGGGWTDEGLKRDLGLAPDDSLKPLIKNGLIQKNAEGFYELGARTRMKLRGNGK